MDQNFEFYFFLEPDISFSVQWRKTKKNKETETGTETEKGQQMMMMMIRERYGVAGRKGGKIFFSDGVALGSGEGSR